MTQVVNIPGVGKLNFPDGMSQIDMAAAIQKNFPQIHPPRTSSLNDSIPVLGAPATGSAGAPEGITSDLKRTGAAFADPLIGAAELGASGITNIGGKIAGGLAGIVQGAGDTLLTNPYNYLAGKPLVNPMDSAANRSRSVEDALTYQPGRRGQELIGGITQGAKGLYGKTGLPTLTPDTPFGQTFAPAVGDVLASLSALPKVGSGVLRAADAATIGKPKPFVEPVPTREQLGKAATAAYKRADDAGITVSADSFNGLKTKLSDSLAKDGIDPDLHPNATAALKRVTAENGPVTLQKLETLRRIALDAEDTPVKADARKAGDIVDTIDEYVDGLSDTELTSGQAKDAAALKEARALYTRTRKADDIERLIRRAEYSPSGFENGLRIEFRSLAKNDRRFNRFTPEEKAAIDNVAKGGIAENALRLLGKAAPTGIVSGGLSSGAGFAFGGPVGAVVVPAAGIAGRVGSKMLTARNARLASETMRRGPVAPPAAPVPQAMQPPLGMLRPPNPTASGLPPDLVAKLSEQLPKPRGVREIRSDLHQIENQLRSLTPADYSDLPRVRAISQEWGRLQAELRQHEQRASNR